jgi:hypothetical protein
MATSSSTALTVRVTIDQKLDNPATRRLAQLIFGASTRMVVASSTGVAS